ncbi:MAG: acyl-CoA dehydrogenase family protein, partial [Agriterribacter sp.]
MDFETDEITRQIGETTRDFALQHIKPYVMQWDETQAFPIEVFKKMGELGLMGVLVPEKYGGAGLGYHEYSTIIQEVAKVCGSVGLSLAAHNSLCTGHILAFGNEEQKQKYLPGLASAEYIGAWGLTEPGTGSDAGNMKTTAVRDGDDWVLNGTKCWITHGISGNIAVVIARTGEPRAKNNATAFIVERGTP